MLTDFSCAPTCAQCTQLHSFVLFGFGRRWEENEASQNRICLTSGQLFHLIRQRNSCLIKCQGQKNKMAKMIMRFPWGVYQIRCLLRNGLQPHIYVHIRGHSQLQGFGKERISGKMLKRSCSCTLKAAGVLVAIIEKCFLRERVWSCSDPVGKAALFLIRKAFQNISIEIKFLIC